jgi:hypothetical protein
VWSKGILSQDLKTKKDTNPKPDKPEPILLTAVYHKKF